MMSKKFNLLLLHQSTDIHPRTWICIKKPGLRNILKNAKEEILRKQGWNKTRFNKEIANVFHCSPSTIGELLRVKREFYPIPIIITLLSLNKDKQRLLQEIKQDIKCLKVNSASAKPIRAVYKLNENLAKILGAFMADGSLSVQVVIAASKQRNLNKIKSTLKASGIYYSSGKAPSRSQYYISVQKSKDNKKSLNKLVRSLSSPFTIQTHYNIELSDEYKDNVVAFNRWIKEEFDIKPTLFRKQKGSWGKEMKSWRTHFSNKILARYLTCFFGVQPGKKTYTAHEPEIIKKSELVTRKAFARGVLMFDGCVSQRSKILLGIKSKMLFSSIKQIWKKDKIKFGESINQKRREWHLFTTEANREEKLLEYFELNTQKYKLMKWLGGDLNQSPIIKEYLSLHLDEILSLLRKIRICDVISLQKHFNCSNPTIKTRLEILKKQGKIKISNNPSQLNKYVSFKTKVYLKKELHELIFKTAREKFRTDKNLAIFLKVHKSVFSNWRIRKTKIPIVILEKMASLLDINFEKVLKNAKKTNRKIVEIIN